MKALPQTKAKNFEKIKSFRQLRKTGKFMLHRPKYAFFGSFDPFTYGHKYVYEQAKAELGADIDFVVVLSLFKLGPTFNLEEREAIIKSYIPDANIFYARDFDEIRVLKHRSQKIIKGIRNLEDKAHTNFIFQFYDISLDKLIEIEAHETQKHVSSAKLKQLVAQGQLEDAACYANHFTIDMFNRIEE
jgi:cytidyltransferase-like protein